MDARTSVSIVGGTPACWLAAWYLAALGSRVALTVPAWTVDRDAAEVCLASDDRAGEALDRWSLIAERTGGLVGIRRLPTRMPTPAVSLHPPTFRRAIVAHLCELGMPPLCEADRVDVALAMLMPADVIILGSDVPPAGHRVPAPVVFLAGVPDAHWLEAPLVAEEAVQMASAALEAGRRAA